MRFRRFLTRRDAATPIEYATLAAGLALAALFVAQALDWRPGSLLDSVAAGLRGVPAGEAAGDGGNSDRSGRDHRPAGSAPAP